MNVADSAFGIRPEYRELAQIAYDTVLKTMVEGEKTHPDKPVDGWKEKDLIGHLGHADVHLRKYENGYFCKDSKSCEDNIAHALTRCAMIKYLEQAEYKRQSDINSHE
jgi:hypothetical protein